MAGPRHLVRSRIPAPVRRVAPVVLALVGLVAAVVGWFHYRDWYSRDERVRADGQLVVGTVVASGSWLSSWRAQPITVAYDVDGVHRTAVFHVARPFHDGLPPIGQAFTFHLDPADPSRGVTGLGEASGSFEPAREAWLDLATGGATVGLGSVAVLAGRFLNRRRRS